MAAVELTAFRPCTPVGYEFVARGVLLADVTAGQLVTEAATGWDLTAGGDEFATGITLMSGVIGETIDIGKVGEGDLIGATLTPGAALYPSATVDGGIDDTPTTGGLVQMRATKIGSRTVLRYNFLP